MTKKIRLLWAGAYEVQYDRLCLSLFPDAIQLQMEQGFDRQKTLLHCAYYYFERLSQQIKLH